MTWKMDINGHVKSWKTSFPLWPKPRWVGR